VIFSGGSYNKIYGANGFYLIILKKILDQNPSVIILYAGWGDEEPFKKFIKKNHYEKRLLLLGNRIDINEVVAHCDIYLGTYPIGGGLMTQYAAINGKPIVTFMDSDGNGNILNSFFDINPNGFLKISFSDIEEFLLHINLLVNNKDFRKKIGEKIRSLVITPEQFEIELKQLINTQSNSRNIRTKNIDYDLIVNRYLKIDKFRMNTSIIIILVRLLGIYSIVCIPARIIRFIPKLILLSIKKLFKFISKQ
jgi:glycosyltransferase involved in cell wall biosynthesis